MTGPLPFGFPLDRHPAREELRPPCQTAEQILPLGIPDHAAAFAEVLTRYARLIRAGRSVEDCANELLPIVRMAARRV